MPITAQNYKLNTSF